MGWLFEIKDKDEHLYPEIRKARCRENANEKHWDMVRYEYIKHLIILNSEHNAEYNPFSLSPAILN